MIKNLLKKVTGDPLTKKLKVYRKQVEDINQLADAYSKKSDKELKTAIADYRQQIADDKTTLDEILNDVFAITREMAERKVEMRPFDVQLIGGLALHEGTVAEMRTGEGKTLVATLPVVLNGLTGKGVHVVTVNDYLARRDAGWMAQVYDALGLSVGVIKADESFIYDADYSDDTHDDPRLRQLKPCSRREAYAADVTYGTNNEFGFDYLRDNMARSAEDIVQGDLNFAIVDEVDSILIDEARTPLIISAPATTSSSQYQTFAKAVSRLKPEHYEVDEKRRSATLTDEGIEKLESVLKLDNLYDPKHVQAVYHLEQALKAQTLFKRDKNYVINNGEIVIVDEFTGRLMQGRRYSEGLHQAIEAKENVEVQQESMTLATISFQNYFRLYDKLSGMTGTAATEAEEFFTIYKLDVTVIPTNEPIDRDDKPDRIYGTEKGKYNSIVEEVQLRIDGGQPVLIGTVSVEKNEYLSKLLNKAGINHEVLNAKNNEREAAIVENAGHAGAVTLATNIAGRGTDIKLGEGVVKAGGLHVIGTERHESRRIDNQLRGRSGRQGDPGSTQFYISAEDDMMRIFGGDRMKRLMERMGVDESTPIENKSITKVLENAQEKVENMNFDQRKQVVQYDDVMNKHRKQTYRRRRAVLRSENIKQEFEQLLDDELDWLAKSEQLTDEQRVDEFANVIPISKKQQKVLKKLSGQKLVDELAETAKDLHTKREQKFTPEIMRQIEREVYLRILDDQWMQHLENMQHLRDGINWRSVGQRDPLVEYRREGQQFFEEMMGSLRSGVLRMVYRAEPQPTAATQESSDIETELTKAAIHARSNAQKSGESSATRTKKQTKKKGRHVSSAEVKKVRKRSKKRK